VKRISFIPVLPVLVAVALAAPAHAHEMSGHIAPSGLEFLGDQIPSLLPTHMSPPAMTMDLLDCPGDRVVQLTQRDTELDLVVDDSTLSVPQPGVLRVELQFDVFANGEAYVLYPYACFGSATCHDELTLYDARAVFDFTAGVDADGKSKVTVTNIDLLVVEDDIDFVLSDCAIDSVANWVIDYAKGWLLDMLLEKLEGVAQEQMAPFLERLLDGFLGYEGTFAITDFAFAITDIDPRSTGLSMSGDLDFFSSFGANACVGADPGEPASHPGTAPDLSAGASTDISLALNLGVVDDLRYQVWRDGIACLNEERLRALGVELDLADAASVLPGFPPTSELDISLRLAVPPRVEGGLGNSAMLTLVANDIEVSVSGTAPDGTVTELVVEVDAAATATVAIDPSINALTLQINAVQIVRFGVNEEYAAETGFDVAQLQVVIETLMLPTLLDELTDMPITGPIFGVAGYYLLLRDMSTSPSHLMVDADLFRAPATDGVAPQTRILDYPRQPVRPADAIVYAAATDDLIPGELLRYRFSVDGVAQPPSYLSLLQVGADKESGTYQVAVSALDLHDNEDQTPEVVSVTVDGIRPTLRLLTDRIVQLESNVSSVTVEWNATDDLTPPERIGARVSLYRILDPQDLTDSELIGEAVLAPGSSQATVSVSADQRYRVIVTVTDEVGNATYTSALVRVAGESSGCGCSQSGANPAGGAPVALALLSLLLWRRRERVVVRAGNGRR